MDVCNNTDEYKATQGKTVRYMLYALKSNKAFNCLWYDSWFLFQQEEMEQINQQSENTIKKDKKQVVFIEVNYFII